MARDTTQHYTEYAFNSIRLSISAHRPDLVSTRRNLIYGEIINTSELPRTFIVSEYIGAFRILVGPAPACPAFHPFRVREQGASGAHEVRRSKLRAALRTRARKRTLQIYSKKRHIYHYKNGIFGEGEQACKHRSTDIPVQM